MIQWCPSGKNYRTALFYFPGPHPFQEIDPQPTIPLGSIIWSEVRNSTASEVAICCTLFQSALHLLHQKHFHSGTDLGIRFYLQLPWKCIALGTWAHNGLVNARYDSRNCKIWLLGGRHTICINYQQQHIYRDSGWSDLANGRLGNLFHRIRLKKLETRRMHFHFLIIYIQSAIRIRYNTPDNCHKTTPEIWELSNNTWYKIMSSMSTNMIQVTCHTLWTRAWASKSSLRNSQGPYQTRAASKVMPILTLCLTVTSPCFFFGGGVIYFINFANIHPCWNSNCLHGFAGVHASRIY